MLTATRYPEGVFPPKRTSRNNWHVWCRTGILQVLRDPEFLKALQDNPRGGTKIIFDNGSSVVIRPGDELWEALTGLIKMGYAVEVFPFLPVARYTFWTGAPTDEMEFDAISISRS